MKTIAEQIGKHGACHVCFEYGHKPKDCPEQKKDLEMVGPMAAFVAARLNYIVPKCNGPRRLVGRGISTIRVDQHKEKFWYVRIYCALADPTLVKERWSVEKKETDPDEPPQEFKDKCLRHDAWHYRKCHLEMLQLLPERVHKRLTDTADYQELLHPTVEAMEARINEIEESDLRTGNHDSLSYYRERYGVETNLELKEKLKQLYVGPSLREQIGD